MFTYDYNFEKLKSEYESGKIETSNLTEDQMKQLMEYYKKEIEENKIEIAITNKKIKSLKNKIDNLV